MTPADKSAFWQLFHVFQAKAEKKYQPLVEQATIEQITAFLAYAKDHGLMQAVGMMDEVITHEPILKVVRDIYHNVGVKWGMVVYRQLKKVKANSFVGEQSDLLDYMEEYFVQNFLNRATFAMTETLRDWIRDQVFAGLAEGRSYDYIAAKMLDSAFIKWRALRIVRTESVRAANAGSMRAAKDTGLVLNKVWISAKDDRTRRLPRDGADHLHMDGQAVAIDAMFSMETKKHGIVQLSAPGDPSAPGECTINCRCTQAYQAVRDSAGRPLRVERPPLFQL